MNFNKMAIPKKASFLSFSCRHYHKIMKLRASSHFDISIRISRHTQKQYDADN